MLKINSNNRIKELEERVNDLAFEVIRLIQSNRDLKQQVKKNKDDLSGSKRELTKVKQKLKILHDKEFIINTQGEKYLFKRLLRLDDNKYTLQLDINPKYKDTLMLILTTMT